MTYDHLISDAAVEALTRGLNVTPKRNDDEDEPSCIFAPRNGLLAALPHILARIDEERKAEGDRCRIVVSKIAHALRDMGEPNATHDANALDAVIIALGPLAKQMGGVS